MKHISLLFLALCCTLSAWAWNFQYGDLYYTITSPTTVEVACQYANSTANYSDLTEITIPDSVKLYKPYRVTGIGEHAFEGCITLKRVVFEGDTLKNIGKRAFASCISLRKFVVPNGVTEIQDGAFYNCQSLYSIRLGDNIVSIGAEAFAHCKSLRSIRIPNSVTHIGDKAFLACPSLHSIDIGDGI